MRQRLTYLVVTALCGCGELSKGNTEPVSSLTGSNASAATTVPAAQSDAGGLGNPSTPGTVKPGTAITSTATPGAATSGAETPGTATSGSGTPSAASSSSAPSPTAAVPNPSATLTAAATTPSPTGTPTGISVTTHDLDVPDGTVFNVADNYFNDRFTPPTPVANFGLHSQITTVVNDDGSLDVAWLDYTDGKGQPWAVQSPSMIYLTHIDPALSTATTQPSGVLSYKLLGFTKDAAGAYYLAYNKDHAFKTDTQDDENNLDGNELHVTKLSDGAVVWDQLLFGDTDNNEDETLGDPGGGASGVLGYDAKQGLVVLYTGHTMMWDGVRHQAGYVRLIEASSGTPLAPGGDDVIHFGAGWWYSHNFNQRLIVDDGEYYLLAHGDAYPRQLGFARWSLAGYTVKNETGFDESYFDLSGEEGDNNTNAQTGQFVRLPDGRFVLVHTSSDGRTARDVRVTIADGDTGKAAADAVWLTTNSTGVQATMPKVELLGDNVLVTYALWDSSKRHELVWYAALLDHNLAVVAEPKVTPNVEFVDSAPLFRFQGGANSGQVGWVSGNAKHTLSVHVASLAGG
jgi:hypothetical protein